MKKVFYVFSLMLVCAIAMAQTADNAATGSAVVLSSAGRTSCDYVQLWKDMLVLFTILLKEPSKIRLKKIFWT